MIGGYPRFDALFSPVDAFYSQMAAKHGITLKRFTVNSRLSLLLSIFKSNSWAGRTHSHLPWISSGLDRLPFPSLSLCSTTLLSNPKPKDLNSLEHVTTNTVSVRGSLLRRPTAGDSHRDPAGSDWSHHRVATSPSRLVSLFFSIGYRVTPPVILFSVVPGVPGRRRGAAPFLFSTCCSLPVRLYSIQYRRLPQVLQRNPRCFLRVSLCHVRVA